MWWWKTTNTIQYTAVHQFGVWVVGPLFNVGSTTSTTFWSSMRVNFGVKGLVELAGGGVWSWLVVFELMTPWAPPGW